MDETSKNAEPDISPLHITESDKVEAQIKTAVDDLILYSNLYIEKHGIECAKSKLDDVKKELVKVLKLIEDKQICCKQKAQALLYKGKALNVVPDFNPDAYDALSKAVKLEPNNVEAWNELGECYLRKRDYEEAVKCFTGAITRESNQTSLRRLSQALRQVGGSLEERSKAIVESVDKAKAAVQLDVTDGLSWECLGTAYFVLFFTQQMNTGLLKQSLQAYSQAENDVVSKHRSDLWYNQGIIQLYEENYQRALEHFHKANLLEPSWTTPLEKEQSVISYLTKVEKMLKDKGKLRVKKLKSLVDAIGVSSLGPYSGGSYMSKSGEATTLDCMLFDTLQSGCNKQKVILGKVVSTIPGDMVPFTFCMIDKQENCIAVTVYNFAEGQGVIIGDSVAIPEPYVQNVDVNFSETQIAYRSIRVHVPVVLVVNGRKLGREKMAYAQFSIGDCGQ